MNSSLKGLALVTGGSRGIGSAISKKLGAIGYHVVVNYVSNEARAQEVVREIVDLGGSAEPLRFDVSKEEEIQSAFQKISESPHPLRVLVNNAGISEDSLILRLKKESLDRTLDTNLSSAILCSKEAARLMMKQRTGSIIQISSVVGEMGNAGLGSYAAAIAGMMGLSKSLA